ncbi:hypothetical protein VHEMI00010 [[Torrubiella] hemipterigena]|uniref:Uncharacterized protein n=1 Tax=[Torrubiella] hemipterigena TaxID=1531966 RepID=A0A0A1SP75_9HYPO|nr:hypothetical protein VHEMI00010 [[Torrubiella] hemipterigena]
MRRCYILPYNFCATYMRVTWVRTSPSSSSIRTMSSMTRYVLGFQSIPVMIAGIQAIFFRNAATAPGQVLEAVPQTGLHIFGLSSLTLGLIQLVLALRAPPSTQRDVLYAMAPTKALATYLMWSDGHVGVATWEAISGIVYCIL